VGGYRGPVVGLASLHSEGKDPVPSRDLYVDLAQIKVEKDAHFMLPTAMASARF